MSPRIRHLCHHHTWSLDALTHPSINRELSVRRYAREVHGVLRRLLERRRAPSGRAGNVKFDAYFLRPPYLFLLANDLEKDGSCRAKPQLSGRRSHRWARLSQLNPQAAGSDDAQDASYQQDVQHRSFTGWHTRQSRWRRVCTETKGGRCAEKGAAISRGTPIYRRERSVGVGSDGRTKLTRS